MSICYSVKLNKYIVAAIALLFVVSGSWADSTASSEKVILSNTPKLLRIATYRWSRFAEKNTLDIEAGKIASVWFQCDDFNTADFSITKEEAGALRNLVKVSQLHSFKPQMAWFKDSGYILEDYATCYLALTWEDKEAVFCIPPDSLLDDIIRPEYQGYKYYFKKMHEVSEQLNRLLNTPSYDKNHKKPDKSLSDVLRADFENEYDVVHRNSLPLWQLW